MVTLNHQVTRQLDDETSNAVVGNVGTFIALRVDIDAGARRAPSFSSFQDQVRPEDLTHLPNFTALDSTLITGDPTQPFTLATQQPLAVSAERVAIIREVSGRRHGISIAH